HFSTLALRVPIFGIDTVQVSVMLFLTELTETKPSMGYPLERLSLIPFPFISSFHKRQVSLLLYPLTRNR
ncbi:MAG: hypothetical protein OXE41_02565, partial [Gammaproteobacteria bacterium]|nr:hypothetical protein [Gammaproteobacteria bacterium]